MKLQDFKSIHAGGRDLSKVISQGKEIWSGLDDVWGTPGPKNLRAGTLKEGFYGEVPASEFITGNELCRLAGITAGTSQFSNEPWLKFSYLNETVFVAKKPIRYNISWNSINSAGCVTGSKTVTIKGQKYKVTLLKGITEGKQNDTSEYDDTINHNSMWNRLMGQVHEKAPSNWTHKDNMENTLVNWGVNYTDADLLTHHSHGNGSLSWCQEYVNTTDACFCRGGDGVSYSQASFDKTHISLGFRPALILIP